MLAYLRGEVVYLGAGTSLPSNKVARERDSGYDTARSSEKHTGRRGPHPERRDADCCERAGPPLPTRPEGPSGMPLDRCVDGAVKLHSPEERRAGRPARRGIGRARASQDDVSVPSHRATVLSGGDGQPPTERHPPDGMGHRATGTDLVLKRYPVGRHQRATGALLESFSRGAAEQDPVTPMPHSSIFAAHATSGRASAQRMGRRRPVSPTQSNTVRQVGHIAAEPRSERLRWCYPGRPWRRALRYSKALDRRSLTKEDAVSRRMTHGTASTLRFEINLTAERLEPAPPPTVSLRLEEVGSEDSTVHGSVVAGRRKNSQGSVELYRIARPTPASRGSPRRRRCWRVKVLRAGAVAEGRTYAGRWEQKCAAATRPASVGLRRRSVLRRLAVATANCERVNVNDRGEDFVRFEFRTQLRAGKLRYAMDEARREEIALARQAQTSDLLVKQRLLPEEESNCWESDSISKRHGKMKSQQAGLLEAARCSPRTKRGLTSARKGSRSKSRASAQGGSFVTEAAGAKAPATQRSRHRWTSFASHSVNSTTIHRHSNGCGSTGNTIVVVVCTGAPRSGMGVCICLPDRGDRRPEPSVPEKADYGLCCVHHPRQRTNALPKLCCPTPECARLKIRSPPRFSICWAHGPWTTPPRRRTSFSDEASAVTQR
ncbi:hypothetical protein PHLGIDRAFT_14981 [Phlebiopsis gigantea 11061_1 CR5-6]|uniref:Uncharacterized protein n=1 Tax=Phlebiopsis gigantea (strain 11061_1 CR5-6) TaxID=745531 RepID=A0A0C3S7K7_PHLG1|nr:hypothetical protein PHLGIDRAFT_14981 [Phlebiopsis gigantea 11061_1 CR5-6]